MTEAYVNAIGTAVPTHDAHHAFLQWAERQIDDSRALALFRRMAKRSGIERRWTVLPPAPNGDQTDEGGFYAGAELPSTAARMQVYADSAPDLAIAAVEALGRPEGITHLVVASCTGFVAPGVDQIIANRLGLSPTIERTLIGFMGCYAAVSALRTAHHIVRSEPRARVLVITVELCTLHLQSDFQLESILAMLLFGDGAAAALVTADRQGVAIFDPFAFALPDSQSMIRWTIGDSGFAMHLAGGVPLRIGEALADPTLRNRIRSSGAVDAWAVHAGGRSVLDAVEQALELSPEALSDSRDILRNFGNMSSATLMFVLDRVLKSGRQINNGAALAFGPGMAAEGFHFRTN